MQGETKLSKKSLWVKSIQTIEEQQHYKVPNMYKIAPPSWRHRGSVAKGGNLLSAWDPKNWCKRSLNLDQYSQICVENTSKGFFPLLWGNGRDIVD